MDLKLAKTDNQDLLWAMIHHRSKVVPDAADQIRISRTTAEQERLFQILKTIYSKNIDKRMQKSNTKICESCGREIHLKSFESVEWLIIFYIHGICIKCYSYGLSYEKAFTLGVKLVR